MILTFISILGSCLPFMVLGTIGLSCCGKKKSKTPSEGSEKGLKCRSCGADPFANPFERNTVYSNYQLPKVAPTHPEPEKPPEPGPKAIYGDHQDCFGSLKKRSFKEFRPPAPVHEPEPEKPPQPGPKFIYDNGRDCFGADKREEITPSIKSVNGKSDGPPSKPLEPNPLPVCAEKKQDIK